MADTLTATAPSPAPQRWRWFDRPLRHDRLFWYSLGMIALGPLNWVAFAGVPIEMRRARRRRAAGLPGYDSRRTPILLGVVVVFALVVDYYGAVDVLHRRAERAAERDAYGACMVMLDAFGDGIPSDRVAEDAFRRAETGATRAVERDPRWQPLLAGVATLESAWEDGTETAMLDGARAFDQACALFLGRG